MGGPLFKKFQPHLTESVLEVGDLHLVTLGSVIVASVGSGAQLPHTDVATHPEVLPPDSRDILGCYLSSFLCWSEDYQVVVHAGTAPRGGGGSAMGHHSAAEGGHAADGGHQPPPWVARPP